MMSQFESDMPPQAITLQMLTGALITQTLAAVTRLNVPDFLQEHGPLTARQLTEDYGVDAMPEMLERALRACASVGVFTEDANGCFGPTLVSEILTSNSPMSLKKMAEMYGGTWWKVWTGLPEALRTGKPQVKAQLGMDYWDYCQANPAEMEDFGLAMQSRLEATRAVIQHCDLSWAKTLVDVGGGFGHVAIALLYRFPQLQACVVDLPELIPIAEKHIQHEDPSVLERLSFAGQDMFTEVPPGDVYILSAIIHDWDDASCIRVLKNCYNSMKGYGRVFCVDAVLPPMGNTGSVAAKFLDVNMMVTMTGKERTEAQWRWLFNKAGFEVLTITHLGYSDTDTCLIEGVKRF